MDTSFAGRFGAVELIDTLPVLARSQHACNRLKKAIGKERGDAAVEMLKGACLDGDLGSEIQDFFLDEIVNEAREVWSGFTFDPNDEADQDSQFPISIKDYEGVYFVWQLECEPQGYFLNRNDAELFVLLNVQNVRDR